MPLYKVALRLSNDSTWARRVKWSNVFYVNTPTPGDASYQIVNGWELALRQATRQSVFAYEVYSSSVVAGDNSYDVRPISIGSQRGSLSLVDLGQQYQSSSCLGVMLPVTGSRPSRKFWRPGLYENDVVNGEFVIPQLIETVTNAFNLMLTIEPYVDPDGEAILPGVRVRYTQRVLGRQAGLNLPAPPSFG